MTDTERELRTLICRIGQLMHQQGFIDGTGGNISARLDDDRILLTPSGLAKGFMTPEQLIVVNGDGQRVDEPTPKNAQLKPTSETPMHLACYRQRPDVMGVVHAHPLHVVALTIAGYDFEQFLIPEVTVFMGMIPVAPYSTPSSDENRAAIEHLIPEHDVILLSNHGSLTVAADVWKAYLLLESLEHSARILYLVESLGGPSVPIPPDAVQKLIEQRRKLGLSRPGEDERFRRALEKSRRRSDI